MAKIITFETGNNGKTIARIDGKISFPQRGGLRPDPGERWKVEIAGQNPKGTVNFLKCIAPLNPSLQRCRELGLKEKLEWSTTIPDCYIRFLNAEGQIIASFSVSDYPEEYPEQVQQLKEMKKAAEHKAWEKTARIEKEAEAILARKTGAELETRVVTATSYKVEVIEDEDWGLHKADSGYSIRVTPVYEGAVENPFRTVLEQVYHDYYGEPCSWANIEDGAEDEAMMEINGPCRALVELSWDKVYQDYYQLTVQLTEEQIQEIQEKYFRRENKEFTTTAKWWILKIN
jgi:hypothetical protein